MKLIKIGTMTVLVAIIALSIVGCEQPVSSKEVADEALMLLKSMRGAATYAPHAEGNRQCLPLFSIDSFYIDDTTYGVRSVGWIFWDDNNTPPDTTDDIFRFIGQNIYLDWGFTENWFLQIKVDPSDRETEMAVKNVNTAESLEVHFGSVNRPGGVQYGPGTYINTTESIDLTMGIHHAETPDNYDDNYSWLEFFLYAAADKSSGQYWVHADFRPDNSGSGEIREQDASGEIVATFEWDEFGRGTLAVDGYVYPFEW